MRRMILPLLAASFCAAATWQIWPRAVESAALLSAQDDPVRLADYAVAKTLTPSVADAEIAKALAAGDAELALSFLDLAREHDVAVDPALAARVEQANGTGAQVVHAAWSFGHGFVTGAPGDLAGLAGTATGDLFVFGDVRDAVREGVHMARGEPTDEIVLGLACAGLAITAGTYATFGAGAPARIGVSVVKAARSAGRMSAPIAGWLTRAVRDVVDTKALGGAMSKVSLTSPGEAVRLARDAVKVERGERILALFGDVGRVQSKAGTKAALEGLELAQEPKDMSRLARLAETKGGKTRAIVKLAGRSAFVLTAAAMELASWLFAAICAVFGFCSGVKRTTERATESYLRWRKRRRARMLLATAAA
jgi:hypothetical protein